VVGAGALTSSVGVALRADWPGIGRRPVRTPTPLRQTAMTETAAILMRRGWVVSMTGLRNGMRGYGGTLRADGKHNAGPEVALTLETDCY